MSKVNLGAGACPMGSSPCGFGSPGAIPSSPPVVLRRVDSTIGAAVALNPVSGDYTISSAGERVGAQPVEQMVYLALRTIKGSSAVTELGIGEFPAVIDDDLPARIRSLVDAALSALVTAGLVEVTGVETARQGSSGASIVVGWRDLSTGQIQSTFV